MDRPLEQLIPTDPSRFGDGWFPIVSLIDNAFLNWRLDSVIEAIMGGGIEQYLVGLCGVFFFGMAALTGWKGKASFWALGVYLGIVTLFSNNLVVASVFAWMPWVSVAGNKANRLSEVSSIKRMLWIATFIFLGLRVAETANYFAILTLAFGLYGTSLLGGRIRSPYILLLIAPSLWELITLAAPAFPAYSSLGHLVRDDGLAGNILPLVSQMPPIPIIDRPALKETYWLLAVVTLLIGVVFRYLFKIRWSLVVISAALVIDVAFHETISQIGPIAVLSRLLPHQFYFSWTPMGLVGIFYLFFVESERTGAWLLAAVPSVLLFGYAITVEPNLKDHGVKAFTEWKKAEERTSGEVAKYETALISPSYDIINTYGLWIIDRVPEVVDREFRNLRRMNAVVTTSHKTAPEEVKKLRDRDAGTRWFRGGGTQRGDEWVHLRFDDPWTFDAIELDTGLFHSDFPTALRISTANNCPEGAKKHTGYSVVYENLYWDGPLSLSEDGFIYLGPQGQVQAYFKEPVTARCFLMEQTGKSPHYDWSIAKLRVLTTK